MLSSGLGLMAVALAGVAAAQGTPARTAGDGSEEVVVTATRREAQVQDIPLSVSAYTGQALEARNVTSFQDLTKIDPTFATQNFGAAFNQYIIRGVASQIGQTVGVYLDDAPILGGSLTEDGGDGKPGLRLHDIQRVEILRGPQGTLFGSSSMSGTLRVIENRPDFKNVEGSWSASMSTTDGGNNLYMGDVAVNLPVVKDKLAIRTVLWGESGGGFIDQETANFDYKNANDVTTKGGRISIGAEVTPEFHLLGMYTHQEIDVDGVQSWALGQPDYVSNLRATEPYSDDYDLGYVEATYDASFGTFLFAYSNTQQWVSRTADTSQTCNNFGIPGACAITQAQNFDADTLEGRFSSSFDGPFQVVVGAYYENSTVSNETTVKLANSANGEAPCVTYRECTDGNFSRSIVFSTVDNIDVEQYALYAQGDYEITSQLTATVGIRYYSADIKDYGTIQQDVFATNPVCAEHYNVPRPVCGFALGDITVPYARESGDSSESKTTFNFSLLYEMNDDVSFYARAASGFRIGGVNNIALLAGSGGVDVPDSYGPDTLWSYELGTKAYFWERKGNIDLAVYYIDWTDQQLGSTDPSGAFDFIINGGKTAVYGVELQGTIMPVDGLTLGGGITFTDATLAEDLPAVSTSVGDDGDRIPGVAKWRGSVTGEYEFGLTETTQGYVQASANFRSKTATAFNDTDPNYRKLDSYWLWDAAVGVRYEQWDAQLFFQNIGNEAAQLALNVGNDGLRVYSPRPFTVGLRISSSF
ncbi:MAG: TonB-dependent receptor [Alphaproteobacteria bacterium]|nr:TonB-dependent receptor [Alphaproteobacteria bacterium]